MPNPNEGALLNLNLAVAKSTPEVKAVAGVVGDSLAAVH
jgi:hypothetical protein